EGGHDSYLRDYRNAKSSRGGASTRIPILPAKGCLGGRAAVGSPWDGPVARHLTSGDGRRGCRRATAHSNCGTCSANRRGRLAATLTLAVMVVVFLVAAMFRRVSVLSFWTLTIAIGAALAAAVLLLVQNVGWSAIGEWFTAQTALTGSAYFLGVAAVAAVLGYLALRRATPVSCRAPPYPATAAPRRPPRAAHRGDAVRARPARAHRVRGRPACCGRTRPGARSGSPRRPAHWPGARSRPRCCAPPTAVAR